MKNNNSPSSESTQSEENNAYTYDKTLNSLKIFGNFDPGHINLAQLRDLHLSNIDYNILSPHFSSIKKNCPFLTSITFNHNKCFSLYQIDALAVMYELEKISFGLENR
eukprot:UN05735